MTREFLVDINPNLELPEYDLVLYSLYEQPITELYNITNFNIKPFFIGIDEMSFNIPITINENDGQIVRNEIYDMVDGEYYIKLNDSKFFVINKINEKADEDGNVYKEVSAYSREFELTQKKVVDYRANSRMLYDRTNSMLKDEESGLTIERGILNYIFNHITRAWTIGAVDEKVVSLTNEGISRALNFPNSNLIQVFQELQKTYNCVFKFDTINQVVNVESMLDYDINPNEVENSPQFKGLYISDENFIKNMSKNIEYDKVKTRLFLYGKDNISIQTVTPVGLPYVDNFTTFKNTKFMTQELIDKLNEYETLVANANPNFQPKRELLQQKHQELEDLYNADDKDNLNKKGLVALQRQLSLVQTEIDTRVENLAIIKNTISSAEGIDLEDLYAQMKTVQSEIDAFENQKTNIKSLITIKENQIETKNNEIKTVEAEIEAIKDNLSVQAVLSPKLIKELDKFIRVETYNDSNFTEDNIMELYEEGKKNLAKISQPSIQFDVDVVDFLSIVECQHTWDKLVLGDIVLLENKNIGFSYYVRLVGYEHSPDNNSLNLKFSNTNSLDDATLWIKDLLEQMSNTTSTLDFNKYKWDKTENMQSEISKMIDDKLEEARQNILNAVGQRHLFDETGLWLYKENPNGSVHPEQIRAINNTIALTDDNWATVKTAITPQGVVAENIYGKLGAFAKVTADQIVVGESGERIPSDLVEGNQELENFLNTTYPNDKNSIINQIDGKIETWFQVGDPSSSWISSEKSKHTGDMWYNTNTKELKRYTGSSWQLIEDKTAINAYDKANQAKDTADGKRTVFTSTPYTPYQVGDLWRQNNTVTGFKICVTGRTSGNYISNDWQVATDIQDYVDKNALKQNFYYNRTKITQNEGIEVYDNLGNKALQMGGIATGTNPNTKNAYGFKAFHEDGSFSAITKDNFIKKYQYGEATYLNDIYVEEFRISPGFASDSPPPLLTVQLPQSFRNRNGRVKFFLSLSGFDVDLYADNLDYAVVTLEVASYNLNTSVPHVDVRGYVKNVSHNSLYSGLDFLILAIGC